MHKEFLIYKKLSNHLSGGRVHYNVKEKTAFGFKEPSSPWLYKDAEKFHVIEKKAFDELADKHLQLSVKIAERTDGMIDAKQKIIELKSEITEFLKNGGCMCGHFEFCENCNPSGPRQFLIKLLKRLEL